MRTCKECKRTLDDEQFGKNRFMCDGRLNTCKRCVSGYMREYRKEHKDEIAARKRECAIRNTYGLSIEDVGRIFENQGSSCAICGRDVPTGRGWQIDHDHKTGRVRGILCHRCNTALGMAKDNPDLLQQAMDYLRKYDGSLPADEDWDGWLTRWVS